MKKCVFLGSRVHVYNSAVQMDLGFERIYALKDSPLAKELDSTNVSFFSFVQADGPKVLTELYGLNFDVLISNGCPILFPVDKFKPNQILINIHPTYLPHLQGKTPLNGVFYLGYDFYGATMHYIDKGIDTGNIIYQIKHDLTPDIDLGLVYFLSMGLEGDVFKRGWQLLLERDFKYQGIPQSRNGTYFNRSHQKRIIDFNTMETELILRKIKSFGISTQGCIGMIDNMECLFFDAEEIVHKPLLEKAINLKPGEIFLRYDRKLLIKTLDGLIKIVRSS